MATKLDQARFLGMKLKPERPEASPHVCWKCSAISLMFEPCDQIVGVPDDNHVSMRVSVTPLLGPEIEDVVEIHVCQQRRDTAP
jgi:hypothetical protein